MTTSAWARLLPPFLLGGALAVASIVSAGLLLYGGPGFLRALAVVLATLLGSLAAGVAWGHGREGRDRVESLRRRWLLTLVAFALAAVFSGVWEAFGGFGAPAVTQGLGLALLGAFPLFAGGTVLGLLARERPVDVAPGHGERDRYVRGRTGPAALAGAAAGAVVLGFVLFPVFSPTSILLVCLVTLSGAALFHGRTLDAVPHVLGNGAHPPASRASLRIERWVRGAPPFVATALVDDGRVRALVSEGGGASTPFDRALLEGVDRWCPHARRALVLGAGGMVLAGHLARRQGGRDGATIIFAESAAVLGVVGPVLEEAGGAGLETSPVTVHEVLAGSPAHLPPSAFDLVFVDTLAVAREPAAFRFPVGALLRLRSSLREGGVLVAGPLQDGGRAGSLLDAARHLSGHFPRVSLYVGARGTGSDAADAHVPPERLGAWRRGGVEPGTRPAFVVAGLGGPTGWPDRVGGHLRVMLEESGRVR